jgi:hypothetical protein
VDIERGREIEREKRDKQERFDSLFFMVDVILILILILDSSQKVLFFCNCLQRRDW